MDTVTVSVYHLGTIENRLLFLSQALKSNPNPFEPHESYGLATILSSIANELNEIIGEQPAVEVQ